MLVGLLPYALGSIRCSFRRDRKRRTLMGEHELRKHALGAKKTELIIFAATPACIRTRKRSC